MHKEENNISTTSSAFFFEDFSEKKVVFEESLPQDPAKSITNLKKSIEEGFQSDWKSVVAKQLPFNKERASGLMYA